MRHFAQIFLVVLFPSAALAVVRLQVVDENQKPIEAMILIQSHPERNTLLEEKTVNGTFELDEKKLARTLGEKSRVYIIAYPKEQRDKKQFSPHYKIVELDQLMMQKQVKIVLSKRQTDRE